MGKYLIRRVLLMIPTLLIISVVVFSLVRLIPGDAVMLLLNNSQLGEKDIQAYRESLGLTRPLYEQYLSWMSHIVRADLGSSLWTGRPIIEEVADRLPITIELGGISLLFALLIGIPIGVISAVRQDTKVDYLFRSIAILGLAVPGFWLGTMVMVLPSVWFSWTPPLNYIPFQEDPWSNIQQFVIPGALLGLGLSAVLMRMTRSMMLEVLRQDYVRVAWSKGLRESMVVYRHALKNALIPVVSILGVQIAVVIGGSVIMEQIFNLPGVGRMMFRAIQTRDYPEIQGINLMLASAIVWINFLIDVTYAWLDPRIKYS